MLPPLPVQYTCKVCGYTRTYQAKSDCLDGRDLLATICPKCHKCMKKQKARGLDFIIHSIQKIWEK